MRNECRRGPRTRPRRGYVTAFAWLAAGTALLVLVATAPGTAGGWWRPVTFVTLAAAAWVAAGSERAGWLLPAAIVIDIALASAGLHRIAGFLHGPAVLTAAAALPGAVRAWRRSLPPTVGMVAAGLMLGGGALVLTVAGRLEVPLAPAWSSPWLALVLPVVVATATIKRGLMLVGVLVCEPLATTAISTWSLPDVARSAAATGLLRWAAVLFGNLLAVALIALLVAGIDRSLAAQRPGVGLLVAVNVLNVFDAVSTWLLIDRGHALELNPLMDTPAALMGKVVGVAAATVWLRRQRPVALAIPLVPLVWVTLYQLVGWLLWVE